VKAALVVHGLLPTVDENVDAVCAALGDAAEGGADLVVFPETALTGIDIRNEAEHDLTMGLAIPGPETDRIAKSVRRHGVLAAVGTLERAGSALYDSALLLGPDGETLLHYRRVDPGWRYPTSDPAVYREGTEVLAAETDLGRIAILLCGDLFNDEVVDRLRAADPDLLLFPYARCHDGERGTLDWWREEGEAEYLERAALTGATVLAANLHEPGADDPCPAYGGAFVVGAGGRLLARRPPGPPGLLVVDLSF
jgi:N-carbamoylputrescine amidase